MRRKILIVLGLLSIFLGGYLKYLSRNEKDFIYVLPRIKNTEVLDRDIGKYSLLNTEGETLSNPKKNFLNGKIFLDVPNGNYILKAEFDDETKSINIAKNNEMELVRVNLQGDAFSKKQEIFLNLITLTLIGLNLCIFLVFRKKLKRDRILYGLFGLLLLKLIFSFRGNFQTNILIFSEFLVTRGLGFFIIFYMMDKLIDKRKKIAKFLIYIGMALVFLYNFLFAVAIFSPQIYVYLLDNQFTLLKLATSTRKIIDLTRIIFLMIIYIFISRRKHMTLKNWILWSIVGFGYFILEFFHNIFPKTLKLYYFIELIEFMWIYWGLCFYQLRLYTKNLTRIVRYILGLTLAYASLFYFKTLAEPFVIIATIFILDIYTLVIDKLLSQKDEILDKTYNKLSLVQNKKQFKIQLEKEIKKHIKIKSVKVKLFIEPEEYKEFILDGGDEDLYIDGSRIKNKEYTCAFRIEFSGNPYIGLILIEETNTTISYEEYNYMINLSKKIANIASKVRLNSLYEELSFDD